jgi:hypothetical protein
MALLSFTGVKNKKTVVSNYGNSVKYKKRILEQKTKQHLRNVLNDTSK